MLRNLCLLCLLVLTARPLPADSPRPDMVFIIADDLGWGDVAFHGGPAPTPHLDRLAAGGLELTQHYVAPVCSPTRRALLTGRYWSRFGVTSPQNNRALPWDTLTLPRALGSAGYETCLTGKWHLGSKSEWGPNHFGFDHSFGSLAGGVGPYDHCYKVGPFQETWHRNETLLKQDGHVTDLIADEAVRWINERGDKPYFLYVPFTAVHLPLKEPKQWLDRVPSQITGEVPRQYAACIMHLDQAVGRIVAAVEKSGRREKTLIVFTSDNGGSWAENNGQAYPPDDYASGKIPGRNEPFRGQKGDLYEGGIRVPTVIHWPGTLPAGRCQVPVHISDWMPTLSGLAGFAAPDNARWDGDDMWPALSTDKPVAERTLYWTAAGFRSAAVRVGDWKLIAHGKGDSQRLELFHLGDDPGETSNLAEQRPDQLRKMRQALADVAKSDNDAVAKD
jgi:arylsulfatase A-like enzyme